MGMEMEMKQASNKNAQTPKWGDGGGIMGLFLSSFTSSNSSSASSSVPVSSFLLYGTTTHFTLMALYNTFLHYQAQRLHRRDKWKMNMAWVWYGW